MSALRDEIIDAMARTYFVSAFADLNDRLREEGRKYVDPGPGGDWMDIAPATPRAALTFAKKVAVAIEKFYGQPLDVIYQIAIGAPGFAVPGSQFAPVRSPGKRQEPDNFGYGIAMQSVGHGVSWFDDNPTFFVNGKNFGVPSVEFHLDKHKGRFDIFTSGPDFRFVRS